nr:relaxase/mobilization nuclease domain-containing protein [Salmonella enterica]
MRNVKKSSFVELAKYLQDPQNKQERVGVIKVTNCHQENILDAARYDIEPTQRRNTRSEGDKTYHLVISFRPGENRHRRFWTLQKNVSARLWDMPIISVSVLFITTLIMCISISL